MNRFRVTFVDGVELDVEGNNGTEAKTTARLMRGLKKSECKIVSVADAGPPPPPAAADRSSVNW